MLSMTVAEAISKIYPPRGMSMMLMGFAEVSHPTMSSHGSMTLEQAKTSLEEVLKKQSETTSDIAYWSFAGDVSYWSAVVNILEAGILAEANAESKLIPFVEAPILEGSLLIDACWKVERYGKEILQKTKTWLSIDEKLPKKTNLQDFCTMQATENPA